MVKVSAVEAASRLSLVILIVALGLLGVMQGGLSNLGHSTQVAFGGFSAATILSFLSYPRLRRSDLALGLLVLVGLVGLIPSDDSGAKALRLLVSSALGVLGVYSLSQLEALREHMRNRPEAALLQVNQEERRAFWPLAPTRPAASRPSEGF